MTTAEPLLIDVIVPVRNGARYLAEALASIRAQTYGRYALIVVDGGSSDGSDQIAARYHPEQFIRQTQPGLWEAFNLGLAAARGDCVAFLSADDRWAPEKLARQAAALEAQPQFDYALGMTEYFAAPGSEIPASFRATLLGRPVAAWQFECLLARRALFDRVGPLDVSFVYGADTHWFMRAGALGAREVRLPEVLLYKRIHDGNHSLRGGSASAHRRDTLRLARESLARQRGAAAETGPA